jgi:hypothetical protein
LFRDQEDEFEGSCEDEHGGNHSSKIAFAFFTRPVPTIRPIFMKPVDATSSTEPMMLKSLFSIMLLLLKVRTCGNMAVW